MSQTFSQRIISFEEQMRGWIAFMSRLQNVSQQKFKDIDALKNHLTFLLRL